MDPTAREQDNPAKDLRIKATPWVVAQKLMQGGAPKQEPGEEKGDGLRAEQEIATR